MAFDGRESVQLLGVSQVPYSGPGLCRTVETIGLECGLKPLGARTSARTATAVHRSEITARAVQRNIRETATAVHRSEITARAVQRNISENSNSCSQV